MTDQLVQPDEITLDWGQPEVVVEEKKQCSCRLECPLFLDCDTISDYLISMSDVEKMWFEARCLDTSKTALEDFERGVFYNMTASTHWQRWGQQLEVAVRRFLTPRPWAWRIGSGDHDCITRSLQECRCSEKKLSQETELDRQVSLLHRGEIEMLYEDHKQTWSGEDITPLLHDPATKTENYKYRRWLMSVAQVPDEEIGQLSEPFDSVPIIKRKTRKSPGLGVVFYRRRAEVFFVKKLQGYVLIQTNEGLTPPFRFEFHLPLEREILFALSSFSRALITYSCRVGQTPREMSRLYFYGEWDIGEPPHDTKFPLTESQFIFPPRDQFSQNAYVSRFLLFLLRFMKEQTTVQWPKIKSKWFDVGFTHARLFFRGTSGTSLDGLYGEADGTEKEAAKTIALLIVSFFQNGSYQERQRVLQMRQRQENYYVDLQLLSSLSQKPGVILELADRLGLSKSQIVQSLRRQPWLRLRDAKWDLAQAPAQSPQEGSLLCVVCMNDPVAMASRLCGHLSLCKECSHQLDACPICRVPYRSDQLIRIYY